MKDLEKVIANLNTFYIISSGYKCIYIHIITVYGLSLDTFIFCFVQILFSSKLNFSIS